VYSIEANRVTIVVLGLVVRLKHACMKGRMQPIAREIVALQSSKIDDFTSVCFWRMDIAY
jgi:hypothetical protein